MATYKSIRYNVDYQGNAGSLMPLLLFTSDGSDATADFTSKIDSTYKEYLFIFNSVINCHIIYSLITSRELNPHIPM